MGRVSKLSIDEWAEVESRVLSGESIRAVAKSFEISESAVRKKIGAHNEISAQSAQVRTVAQKLAEAQDAVAKLPLRQQHVAVSLAEKLRNISNHLASAAEYGAATAHRMQAIAHAQIEKVSDIDPMESQEVLQGISALTRIANDSARMGVELLGATKNTAPPTEEKPRTRIDPSKLSIQAMKEILAAKNGR